MAIDIHCHVLPGVDDGVRTMEEAIELIRTEATGGTRTFVATPHVIDRRDYDRLGLFAERLAELRTAIVEAEIEAEVALGAEVYPTEHVVKGLEAGLPLTLANRGRHMLVDLPQGALPQDFDRLLFEIQARGVTPILAHPERAAPFQENLDRLPPYLERGIALQVNAGSLAGRYGPRAARSAREILRRRWAHFLASDSHRPHAHPVLGPCAEGLRRELGDAYVALLTSESGQCVLSGSALPARPTVPTERRGWLGRVLNAKRL